MRKEDREFLMTLYRLCEREIDLHYVPMEEEPDCGRLELSGDRPISEIKRLLARRLSTSKITTTTHRKISAVALLRLYGASWSEIESMFGDSFARDLRKGKRYSKLFNLAKIKAKLFHRIGGMHQLSLEDGLVDAKAVETANKRIANFRS